MKRKPRIRVTIDQTLGALLLNILFIKLFDGYIINKWIYLTVYLLYYYNWQITCLTLNIICVVTQLIQAGYVNYHENIQLLLSITLFWIVRNKCLPFKFRYLIFDIFLATLISSIVVLSNDISVRILIIIMQYTMIETILIAIFCYIPYGYLLFNPLRKIS